MNDHIGWRWPVHIRWPTHVYLPIRARQSLTHSPLHMHASPSWSWPPRNTHHNDNKLTTAWLGLSAAERSDILKWISYVRLDRVTWHAWLTMIVYVHYADHHEMRWPAGYDRPENWVPSFSFENLPKIIEWKNILHQRFFFILFSKNTSRYAHATRTCLSK